MCSVPQAVRDTRPPPPPRRLNAAPYRVPPLRNLFLGFFHFPLPYLSGVVWYCPYMDKRVEVRCTEEELARWKQAAGAVPLSRWIRLQCERTLDRREPLPDPVLGYRPVVDAVGPPAGGGVGKASLPVFKPDFGSRLKGGDGA
jgi:hypothetical protein